MKWVLVLSPNGRDMRIETENGEKLTRYISGKIARSLAREHNRVVDYITDKALSETTE